MTALLASVLGNSQRLDGGAMYGNAPRALWERWSPPDERGLIPLATRALLVREPSGRNVLLETGIGAFFEPGLRERYGVAEGDHVLLANLSRLGLGPDDVDVIVLSHLHFDHAGGLLRAWAEGAAPQLAFGRATIVVSDAAWQRARSPHARDRASFVAGLPQLIVEHGRYEIVDGAASRTLGEGYRLHRSDGHTPGLLLTELDASVDGFEGPLVFAADLVPGRPWMHVPITMGYDRCPELLIDEKKHLLADLHARNGALFLTHDPDVAMATVERDERGRYGPGRTWAEVTG